MIDAAKAFRVKVRIFIRHGMALISCPVVDVAAVVQELHLEVSIRLR